ncbi:hypothetical protein BSK52_11845 [Paenibacillus odorifer]|uniref:Nuclease SbcCD subunit C n=2 Tax=Paenibacillus odorifer TaxID=189426 RepID=A0A1R0Y1E2_9BACL|nr:hypothetical protein BSK52_11845 [Paenibacillus odorifer]
MKKKFYIHKISVKNFRGYDKQIFNFFEGTESKKGLVLLGGPNGYGKTSLLDAFEWCFTGTVKRLEEEYDSRSKKDKAANMQIGLLRNDTSIADVDVEIEGMYGDDNIRLTRTYNGKSERDGLLLGGSHLEIVTNSSLVKGTTIDDLFNKEISKYFYERHISSYEKNIKIYQKSREDIYNMFSYFFGGTDEIESIIRNLEGYSDKKDGQKVVYEGVIKKVSREVERINQDLSKQLIKLEQLRQQFGELKQNVKDKMELNKVLNSYPRIKLYSTEKTAEELFDYLDGENLSQNKLILNQRDYLQTLLQIINKQKVLALANDYRVNLRNIISYEEFIKEIFNPYLEKEHFFFQIEGKNKESLVREQSSIKDLQRLLSNISSENEAFLETIKQHVLDLFPEKQGYSELINGILSKIAEKNSLENDLNKYKSVDPVIQSLRAIVDHVDGFKGFQQEHPSCPLCGSSEKFSVKSMELGKGAKELLGDYDQTRANIQVNYQNLKSDINKQIESFTNELREITGNKLTPINNTINAFNVVEPILQASRRFWNTQYELNNGNLRRFEAELKMKVISDDEIIQIENKLIELVDDGYGNLKDIKSKVNSDRFISPNEFRNLSNREKVNLIDEYITDYDRLRNKLREEIGEFNVPDSEETVLSKIRVIERMETNIKNNYLMNEAQKNIGRTESEYKKLEGEANSKNKQLLELRKLLANVKGIRKEFDDKIVEEIRDPLQRIYKRLNRHTNIQAIDLSREGRANAKAKLNANMLTNSKVYVPNVLSTGQISVVSLAVYLTIAMGQKENPFRCYFMDDPIQTMDDLNILSFVDLLRTELAHDARNPGFLDQIFITTCDEDLEKLIAFKMKHFGINYSHLHFNGYGRYQVLN